MFKPNRCFFSGQKSIKSLTRAGSTYVHWGRSNCPTNGTELLYTGYAGGTHHNHKGGGANVLCLTGDPLWNKYDDKGEGGALIYGTGYEYGSRKKYPQFDTSLDEYNTPCSVCYTTRSSSIMIPGRNKCYDGWTLEYHGYLFGNHYDDEGPSEFICIDSNPEKSASTRSEDQSLLHISEIRCGALPCPPYVEGREVTCVVCSR